MRPILEPAVQRDLQDRGFSRRSFGRIAALLAAGAVLPFYNEGALAQVAAPAPAAADGIAYEESAWLNVYAFVTTGMEQTVERGRQILQIEEYENAGTIEGWAVQLEPEQIHRSHES